MLAEGGPVRPVGTDLQERRQEESQHELGIEHERRKPWDKSQSHAAEHEGDDALAGEISQLLYWTQVLMISRGLSLDDVYQKL